MAYTQAFKNKKTAIFATFSPFLFGSIKNLL